MHLGCGRYLSGSGGGRSLSRLLGGLGSGALGGLTLAIDVVILLSGGVDRDLNGDLTALNLLSVHLGASLLLKLLGTEGDETETTALARLTASLQLLDHETGNGAESDLSLGRGVVLEDLEKLKIVSIDKEG